jgi:hypothetical protein
MTKQELYKIYNDQSDLTHYEIMGKKSAIARGLPYYGNLFVL